MHIVGKLIRKELQGDVATELQVFRLIHHAHAPAPNLGKDAVMGNDLTDGLGGVAIWQECYAAIIRGVNHTNAISPVFVSP